jgi:hypothetical protein
VQELAFAYGVFANGASIPDIARQRYEIAEPTADPFSEKGYRDIVQSMIAPPGGGGLRPLAAAIYRGCPDLQRAFPDPQGEDRERFLRWLLTFGAAEHELSEEFLKPFREDWEGAVSGLSSPLARLKHRGMLSLTKRKLRRAPPRRQDRVPAGAASGINFAGSVRSEMGVGESVRCAVRAAKAAGLPVSVKSVDRVGGSYRLLDLSFADDREFRYAFNICHVNADQSPTVLAELGDNFTRKKFNIGYWAWELEASRCVCPIFP